MGKQNSKGTFQDVIKALHKADREIEMERNGHWIAMDRPHKNKKKYCRKDAKKELRKDICSFFFVATLKKFL